MLVAPLKGMRNPYAPKPADRTKLSWLLLLAGVVLVWGVVVTVAPSSTGEGRIGAGILAGYSHVP